MTDEVHLLDDGTRIKINLKEAALPLPLALATAIKVKFERKDKTTFQVDAAVVGDPDDGIVDCYSDETFFTTKGAMKIQVLITYPSGQWHTDLGTFNVATNIVVAEA